jgi:hypothetical protein
VIDVRCNHETVAALAELPRDRGERFDIVVVELTAELPSLARRRALCRIQRGTQNCRQRHRQQQQRGDPPRQKLTRGLHGDTPALRASIHEHGNGQGAADVVDALIGRPVADVPRTQGNGHSQCLEPAHDRCQPLLVRRRKVHEYPVEVSGLAELDQIIDRPGQCILLAPRGIAVVVFVVVEHANDAHAGLVALGRVPLEPIGQRAGADDCDDFGEYTTAREQTYAAGEHRTDRRRYHEAQSEPDDHGTRRSRIEHAAHTADDQNATCEKQETGEVTTNQCGPVGATRAFAELPVVEHDRGQERGDDERVVNAGVVAERLSRRGPER